MKSERVNTSDMVTRVGRALVVKRALVVGWGLSGTQPLAGQVSQMNFFVAIQDRPGGGRPPSRRDK